MQPEAKTKAKLLGSSQKIEVKLDTIIGTCLLEMPGRGETYKITLPSLKITDPLGNAAAIDFTGQGEAQYSPPPSLDARLQ